jgi:hypothetical protein
MTDPVREALEAAARTLLKRNAPDEDEWRDGYKGWPEGAYRNDSTAAVLAFLKTLRDAAKAKLIGRTGEVTSLVWEISYLEERISEIEGER